MSVEAEKKRVREQIWRSFKERKLSLFPPPHGRIPNFKGAEKAAGLLRKTGCYARSKVIFCSPDSPQRPVRRNALRDGKTVVMASPRLKEGFLLLKPEETSGFERYASTISGAFKFGRAIGEMPKVDLAVIGSVAVDLDGNRLGKGGGYGDREIEMVLNANPRAVIATTVHPIQVVKIVPSAPRDRKVDLIVTTERVILTRNGEERFGEGFNF